MRLLGITITVLAVLASGCTGNSPRDKEERLKSQFAELQKRPDIETVTRRYEEMWTKIRERLAKENITTGWTEKKDSAGYIGCGSGFSDAWSEIDTDTGRVQNLPQWMSSGNLPDDKWGRAVAIITEITREYGFDQPGAMVNRPGDHEIVVKDGYGATMWFGTMKNTVFRLTTGCHLTAAAHRLGSPVPTPTSRTVPPPSSSPTTTSRTTLPPPPTPS